MNKTALELTRQEWQAYRPMGAVKDRQFIRRETTEKRWREARQVAGQAAKLLHKRFNAQKVFLFGSTARRSWFTDYSDIDLAVEGVPPELFFAAVAVVTGLSSDFKIDLVDLDNCTPAIEAVIRQDGIEL